MCAIGLEMLTVCDILCPVRIDRSHLLMAEGNSKLKKKSFLFEARYALHLTLLIALSVVIMATVVPICTRKHTGHSVYVFSF